MRPTVAQPLRTRGVSVQDAASFDDFMTKEFLLWARQTRQATNYMSREKATFTTVGTAAYTTIWSSIDMAVGSVVRLEARVVGNQTSDRGTFIVAAFFRNDGVVAQEGATATIYAENPAGYAIRFLVVSNHIDLQVRDAGAATAWSAVIDGHEVP